MTYSVNTFTITGGVGTFDISFEGEYPGYLSEDHVIYYIGEVPQGLESRTFNTPTNVTIDPIPVDGTQISFRRHTSPTTPLVDWLSGAPVTEVLLDESNLQMLYLAQESADAGEISTFDVANYTELARKWAENPEDTPIISGQYSALHHAAKALASAILAGTHSTNATGSAISALASENAALGYRNSASLSADAAAASAAEAATSIPYTIRWRT